MHTISDRLAFSQNRPAGFDYLRLGLASAVIFHHSFTVVYSDAYGHAIWAGPDRSVIGLILPCFFALSGFLVCGSLDRSKTLISFLGLRIIRLFPALILEVTLSALFLGTIFTTFPLARYFTDPIFEAYFLNIIGNIHYLLPGVFEHNISGRLVNSQLWTVPFELECYATIAVLALVGFAARRWLLLISLLALQVAYGIHGLQKMPPMQLLSGRVLVGAFLAGILIFKFRDKVPASLALFVISLIMTVGLLLTPGGDYFLSFPAAYATAYIGTLNPPRIKLLFAGDYSYGLYLYGYPLQQALVAWGLLPLVPWVNFLAVYPIALILAALSWWCIEKPALKLRTKLYTLEDFVLRNPLIAWHSRNVLAGTSTHVETNTTLDQRAHAD